MENKNKCSCGYGIYKDTGRKTKDGKQVYQCTNCNEVKYLDPIKTSRTTNNKTTFREKQLSDLEQRRCVCGSTFKYMDSPRVGWSRYKCICGHELTIPKLDNDPDSDYLIQRGTVCLATNTLVGGIDKFQDSKTIDNLKNRINDLLEKEPRAISDPMIRMADIAYHTAGFTDTSRKTYKNVKPDYKETKKLFAKFENEELDTTAEIEARQEHIEIYNTWNAKYQKCTKRHRYFRRAMLLLLASVIITLGILLGTGTLQKWISTVQIEDEATGITVTSNVDYISRNATLSVVEKKAGDEAFYATAALLEKEATGFVVYDISLLNNTKFGGTMSVSIPIPAQIKTDSAVVYYMKDINTIIEIPSTVEDGFITYETDHFSLYIVAEKISKGIKYTLQGDEVSYSVIGYDGSSSSISIPETYNGIPVTAIEHDAFNSSSISEITLSNKIVKIGERAFASCVNIPKIIIPKTVAEIAPSAFMGWQDTQTIHFEGRGIPPPTWNSWDKDCHAVISWGLERYSIVYELNGGENSAENLTSYTEDTPSFTFKTPTKTGYTFKGWFHDSGLTQQTTEISVGTTGNVTVHAAWEPIRYTLSFHANGGEGEVISTLERTYNDGQALPTNTFTREGYVFAGWNIDQNAKTALYMDNVTDNISNQAGNITLYAIWSPLQYSITFDTDGGTAIPKQYYYYGDITVAPGIPQKTGYNFDGWDFNFGTKMPAKDITVKAKWVPVIYNITYVSNLEGATGSMNTDTALHGEEYILPNCSYKKDFWSFIGWSESASGDTIISPSETVLIKSDRTFYAIWQIKTSDSGQGYANEQLIEWKVSKVSYHCIDMREFFDIDSLIDMGYNVTISASCTVRVPKKQTLATVNFYVASTNSLSSLDGAKNIDTTIGGKVYEGTNTHYVSTTKGADIFDGNRYLYIVFDADMSDAIDYFDNDWYMSNLSITINFTK